MDYVQKNVHYQIRVADVEDAEQLSQIRLQIDGETENLDREKGEAYLSPGDFLKLIKADQKKENHLFLVAAINEKIVAFSRCEGSSLKRFSHKVDFGVAVLKNYWGYQIGSNLLKESINWAQSTNIKKMSLAVLEKNDKAIKLYQKFGFQQEGLLVNDKLLSDGELYHTVLMAKYFD
ncbi:GNAT family N-acetyltransferase [Alkalihalobacillus trypoxylicola]|uniref:GNAT family acetyltransferase n=1 Tax=Alkalihalobacillus trypoxylicola TaxID=519424 RepID=A0A161P5T7_9BACI|nr:GNAT family N-acetyltransferase [Alkalihalobacillus trypoxylicola]KYG25573.1 GNAT family acetyltransferase [Alkalihalobacillus trypoxylicola]